MHAKTTLTRTIVGAAALLAAPASVAATVEPNQPRRPKASSARRSTAASA
jgi:hypothetical protein